MSIELIVTLISKNGLDSFIILSTWISLVVLYPGLLILNLLYLCAKCFVLDSTANHFVVWGIYDKVLPYHESLADDNPIAYWFSGIVGICGFVTAMFLWVPLLVYGVALFCLTMCTLRAIVRSGKKLLSDHIADKEAHK